MKAIETEYKNQISLEVPNLWSRIEAGVDEYEKNKITTTEVKNEQVKNNIVSFNRKKTIVTIGKIAGAAAAIALVATVALTFGNRTASIPAEETNAKKADKAAYVAADVCEDLEAVSENFASADVAEANYSEEASGTMADSSMESTINASEYEQYNETKMLASSIKCSEADADTMVNTFRTCGIGDIAMVQSLEPIDISISEKILKNIDLEQASLLRIKDNEGKEYCICIEKEDDTYVLRFIVEDKENGEVLYIK